MPFLFHEVLHCRLLTVVSICGLAPALLATLTPRECSKLASSEFPACFAGGRADAIGQGAHADSTVRARALAQGFVHAFNGGKTAMATFEKKHFANSAERAKANSYDMFRSDLGDLTLGPVSVDGKQIHAYAKSSKRKSWILFVFDTDNKGFIKSMGARPSSPPGADGRRPATTGATKQALTVRPLDMSVNLATIPQKFGVPGISVAFVRGGKIVGVGSAGVRDSSKAGSIKNDDRFHLGSCTKRMTSFMIYRLIDQGKLKLDTTLGEVLKDVPMKDAYRAVTVRELLQFKGGIQPYLMIAPSATPAVFDTQGTAEDQRRRFVTHVLQEEPVAAPGTKAVYTNAGFAVLALVASQATGKSWEELMVSNVFKPLGMTTAGFGRPLAGSSDAPRGHIRNASGLEPEPLGYAHPASLSAAGDISASMPDFAKYAAEELRVARGQSGILSKQTSALMKEVSGFAEGRTLLGGAGAFTAGITLWPSLDCAAVVGVNSGGGEQLCQQVSQAVERMFVEDKRFTLQGETNPRSYGFALTMDSNGGVIVQGVAEGSIAAKAGLANGDQIIEMNGEPISKMADERRFAALRGASLGLKVKRGERLVIVRMELRTGDQKVKAFDNRPDGASRW